MSRLVRGVKTRNSLTLHPLVVVWNHEGYLSCRSHPEEWGIAAPHQAFQLIAPVLGRGAPTITWCENQQGFQLPGERERSVLDAGVLLKSLHTDSLVLRQSSWALAEEQWLGRHQRHIEINIGWGAARGATVIQGEGWRDNYHCFCVEPSPYMAKSKSVLA